MKDEFVNRLAMFRTVLDTLTSPTYQPVWLDQPPLIFANKFEIALNSVTALETFCRAQETNITGAAVDKEREERELEDVAHRIGRTLVTWFRDQNDELNAAKVDLTISHWRRLRDQSLLEKARLALELTQAIVAGPNATAANGYSLNAAAVQELSKEIDDYAKVIAAPQVSIAGRKALTRQMRDRFNAVEAMFDVLDDLILQYKNTEAGHSMIAAYKAARVVRDLPGGSSSTTTPAPTPPPPQ